MGTLNDNNPKGPDGELFCLQGDRSWRLMDKDITVSNGIGWSPDRKIMYFTDSFRYAIYAYDYVGRIRNDRKSPNFRADVSRGRITRWIDG